MYKKIIFGLAIMAGLASCKGDYENWAQPQSNEATSSSVSATVTGAGSSIDLSATKDSLIQIQQIVAAGGEVTNVKAVATASNVAGGSTYTLYPDASGYVTRDNLNDLCRTLYNHETTSRQFTVEVTCNVLTESGVSIPVTAGTYNLSVAPEMPELPEALYVPGNGQGWAPSSACKLVCTGTGIYEGYAYLDGGFKFTKERDWDHGDYGFSYFKSTGEFTGSDGNLVAGTPGWYFLSVNLLTDKVESQALGTMQMTGTAVGSTPIAMEYDPSAGGFVAEASLSAGTLRFTSANGAFDFGGTKDNLVNGAEGIVISAAESGVYVLKLGRIDSDNLYYSKE